jgi:hypothetical protein
MEEEGNYVDTDILIMGDFNAPPNDKCWQPFHEMEDAGKIKYKEINDNDDFSYLWLANKSDKYVSRIDLTVMSTASSNQVAGEVVKVVRWQPIEEAIARAGNMTDKEVTDVMKKIKR